MSTSNPYFVVEVSNFRRENEEILTSVAFEFGAAGVAESLPFVQPDLRYDPDVSLAELGQMSIYFEKPILPEAAEVLQQKLLNFDPGARIRWQTLESKDWLAEWKKGFKPFVFSGPFWVVPSWCEVPSELKDPKYKILIEPGMAFGTGTHETTQLAAQLLLAIANEPQQILNNQSVLDVGTGTAILALVCERLGYRDIYGIDIDPEARRTARENLELNGSKIVKIVDDDLKQMSQQKFDLVIANIIDGVLLQLAPDLKASMKPGGKLITSGILTDRADSFFDDFALKTGLRYERKVQQGEWCASIWS